MLADFFTAVNDLAPWVFALGVVLSWLSMLIYDFTRRD